MNEQDASGGRTINGSFWFPVRPAKRASMFSLVSPRTLRPYLRVVRVVRVVRVDFERARRRKRVVQEDKREGEQKPNHFSAVGRDEQTLFQPCA
jgi:hypothetical protein